MAVCSALGCHEDAEVVTRLEDGRERPTCEFHENDGEVVGDV